MSQLASDPQKHWCSSLKAFSKQAGATPACVAQGPEIISPGHPLFSSLARTRSASLFSSLSTWHNHFLHFLLNSWIQKGSLGSSHDFMEVSGWNLLLPPQMRKLNISGFMNPSLQLVLFLEFPLYWVLWYNHSLYVFQDLVQVQII